MVDKRLYELAETNTVLLTENHKLKQDKARLVKALSNAIDYRIIHENYREEAKQLLKEVGENA